MERLVEMAVFNDQRFALVRCEESGLAQQFPSDAVLAGLRIRPAR